MKRPDTVTCRSCGNTVPGNSAAGVGVNGGAMVWTCVDCIKRGAMDDVFRPIGESIRQELQSVQQEARDAWKVRKP